MGDSDSAGPPNVDTFPPGPACSQRYSSSPTRRRSPRRWAKSVFLALHENLTRPSILPGFGFWGFGVRFWGKRNPDVVVAVGMWKARVFFAGFPRAGGTVEKAG